MRNAVVFLLIIYKLPYGKYLYPKVRLFAWDNAGFDSETGIIIYNMEEKATLYPEFFRFVSTIRLKTIVYR